MPWRRWSGAGCSVVVVDSLNQYLEDLDRPRERADVLIGKGGHLFVEERAVFGAQARENFRSLRREADPNHATVGGVGLAHRPAPLFEAVDQQRDPRLR